MDFSIYFFTTPLNQFLNELLLLTPKATLTSLPCSGRMILDILKNKPIKPAGWH
jgi:hypothetical protein